MIPGELFVADGSLELNPSAEPLTLMVANTGDRPVQIGSHYHFGEANSALDFDREAARGKQSGRTIEIQRLIGRSLRAAVDMTALGERTVRIDCDVLQADGGTRTASITGASLALADALKQAGIQGAFREFVASISVGITATGPVLDLDYAEDSRAETDMNVVMLESGGFIEIQGTAEGVAFDDAELQALLALARKGIAELITAQRALHPLS